MRAHTREAGSASPSSALFPVPPGSPRQFLGPLPATRVVGKPGPACWHCGDPGHFIDRCPVMEVGTLVRVPDAPQAAPDQAGGYQIPVSIRGGTYWALVDSGCNQTSIHQSLIQPETLDKSCMVRVRCVHGDVVKYPVVLLAIQFRGHKHKVEVAVNPRLRHPLILGTNWPAFKILLGVLCVDASCGKVKPEGEAAVRTGEAEPGPAEAAPGERSAVERLILTECDDFPLEQSQDESLRNAFDQVRSIDGRPLQSARPPSYPYFAILKDRLYRVTQDAQSKQDTTQLLVPKSRREMLFQAAHCNPMAGHLGQAATLNRLMARFFWPGIHENVRRWCAACRECQLVNPPASPKAPLRPLPLMQHVLDLRTKLHTLGQLSMENLLQAQDKQSRLYNRGARLRKFAPGDKVLVLLPTSSSKLLAKWQGPFEVTRQVGDLNYEVVRTDRSGARQIYHLNLLKKWSEVEPVMLATAVSGEDDLGPEVITKIQSLTLAPGGDHLSPSQLTDVARLQKDFADMFSPRPNQSHPAPY